MTASNFATSSQHSSVYNKATQLGQHVLSFLVVICPKYWLLSPKSDPLQMRSKAECGFLQELMSDVKAEVRAVLQQHGVGQFRIKPVQRNYAFENPEVAHRLQWVLKVTYSAILPQLPLGLTGSLHCYDLKAAQLMRCLSLHSTWLGLTLFP